MGATVPGSRPRPHRLGRGDPGRARVDRVMYVSDWIDTADKGATAAAGHRRGGDRRTGPSPRPPRGSRGRGVDLCPPRRLADDGVGPGGHRRGRRRRERGAAGTMPGHGPETRRSAWPSTGRARPGSWRIAHGVWPEGDRAARSRPVIKSAGPGADGTRCKSSWMSGMPNATRQPPGTRCQTVVAYGPLGTPGVWPPLPGASCCSPSAVCRSTPRRSSSS